MEIIKQVTAGGPDKLKEAIELIAECAPLGDPDPCEAAVKIGVCLHVNGLKKDVKFM